MITWLLLVSGAINIALVVAIDQYRNWLGDVQTDAKWWEKRYRDADEERKRYFEALIKPPVAKAAKAKAKRGAKTRKAAK